MSVPDAVARDLIARVPGVTGIEGVHPLGGGCIHSAARIDTGSGPLFCKWNRGDAGAAFGAEARGLEALRRAAGDGGLRIPEVRGWRDAQGDAPGWLALEFLPPSPAGPAPSARRGRGLAAIHRAPADGWGGTGDNRIGSLPQANPATETWAAFWRDARLGPQIRRARDAGALDARSRREVERALDAVAPLLEPVEDDGPSWVHGDLWAGNVHPGPDGSPVLVDPATYRGHREVDPAMAALFGGLSARARAAYEDAFPLRPGADDRRPLYQLYYLLVHVNLFGAGYVASTLDAARRAAAAVR
ncbi:MAG: fructosamine kinase family protein [Longimicrobiales bacterium]